LDLQRRQIPEVLLGVFNVSNSVRFDAAGSLPGKDLVDITSFGKLNIELTQPRVIQFALRFGF
jgi:hypothetical protein